MDTASTRHQYAAILPWVEIEADLNKSLANYQRRSWDDLCDAAGGRPVVEYVIYPQLARDERDLFEGKIYRSPLKKEVADRITAIKEDLKKKGIRRVLLLGKFTLWAFTGRSDFASIRGTQFYHDDIMYVTTHPLNSITKTQWELRPIAFADVRKILMDEAAEEECIVYTPENPQEFRDYLAKIPSGAVVAFDVETSPDPSRVTEFSLSVSGTECIYVILESFLLPIWKKHEEVEIMLALFDFFKREDITVVMHNCIYDISYLELYGIRILGNVVDTMLKAHSLEPELPKALGHLASVHLNTEAWKHLRIRNKDESERQGE